uniref:DNA-directed RNA polymerase n=1 Tax=Watanabea reniformis TaxID=191674 RepID=A0A097KKE8_9CHLO|nr:beta'' subunit of RNA polymerase [Watanabea reniformis]AIT93627.1 beta'' subunit of RNA polymerase [Watanabea reniformis]
MLFKRLQKIHQNYVLSRSLCPHSLKTLPLRRQVCKLTYPFTFGDRLATTFGVHQSTRGGWWGVSQKVSGEMKSLLSMHEINLCLHSHPVESKVFSTTTLSSSLVDSCLRNEVRGRRLQYNRGGKRTFANMNLNRVRFVLRQVQTQASSAYRLCSPKPLCPFCTYNVGQSKSVHTLLARKTVGCATLRLQAAFAGATSTQNTQGEVIKQPFTDILITDFEQISFSTANTTFDVKIGDHLNAGDKIGKKENTPIVVGTSGQVIRIDKEQITLQKTQPVLFYSGADVHVKNGEWVEKGCPILTLTHQTLITGDIVQGIPKIEQLFEAPGGKEGSPLSETLHLQLREIFRQHWSELPLPQAVRRSLEEIQQILVEGIQRVYLSQGVLIADKHIEIVVRQMTSKGQILNSGSTGLFLEEVLPIRHIEAANLTTPGRKALYMPAVIGLTRAALDSESFISAASFQETTRVLSRDAVIGKSDFLKGLKEKVVIGDLISAGTGLDNYFIYNILFDQGYIHAKETKNIRGFTKHDLQKRVSTFGGSEASSKKKHTRKKIKIPTL